MESQMESMERMLCDGELGFALLDALVQANVDLQNVSLEQAKQLLVNVSIERRSWTSALSAYPPR